MLNLILYFFLVAKYSIIFFLALWHPIINKLSTVIYNG